MNAPAESTPATFVILTSCQLTELVETATEAGAARALEAYRTQAPEPESALSSPALARRLGVSRSQIHRLCAEGLPHFFVGDARRHDLAEVMTWLKTKGRVTTSKGPVTK